MYTIYIMFMWYFIPNLIDVSFSRMFYSHLVIVVQHKKNAGKAKYASMIVYRNHSGVIFQAG